MSRMPAIKRETLSKENQEVWDRIVAGRSGAAMRGPFAVLMQTPSLADRVANVEDYFRTEGELPAADRELVILATVRELGARFAWARHEARAKELALPSEVIEALRTQAPLDALSARQRVLVEVTQSLLRAHALPDALHARALGELGLTQLVETVVLIGQYNLIGLLIVGFEVPEESPTF